MRVVLRAREHRDLELSTRNVADQLDELVEALWLFHPEAVELGIGLREDADELFGSVDRVDVGELGAGTSRQQRQRLDRLVASHWSIGDEVLQHELESSHVAASLNRALEVGPCLNTVADQTERESRHRAESFEFSSLRLTTNSFDVTFATEREEAETVAEEETRSHVRNDGRKDATEQAGSGEREGTEAEAAEELGIGGRQQAGANNDECSEFHSMCRVFLFLF